MLYIFFILLNNWICFNYIKHLTIFYVILYNKLKIYYFPFRFLEKIVNIYFMNLKVVLAIKIVQLK